MRLKMRSQRPRASISMRTLMTDHPSSKSEYSNGPALAVRLGALMPSHERNFSRRLRFGAI